MSLRRRRRGSTTLQGRSSPICRSTPRARCASGGLQAPRITYSSMSAPSFAARVARMSISVSTPKPWAFNASRTRSTSAGLNGSGRRVVYPYVMAVPFVSGA